ncbi:hypothetical protein GCM10008939_14560 [Deinococcus aquiradiocola]|uniref:Integrase catalytic domain-containing protein n=1 Tax=Deinococcus aquiradiocola TaxID=393059 RepID=A0A917PD17_9DEIO|nr:hypothetical protein GCM10008939_14560 [Deinococcus aquiradiocola]
MSARTLRFQRDEYQRRGLLALVDGRKLRSSLPLGRHPVEVIQTAKTVISNATNAPTVTRQKHVGDIQQKLKADMKAGKVQLQKGIPSYSGIVRLLDRLSVKQYTYGSAKLRMSMAGRPQRMYQMLMPTRVGEYVVIDASTYDVWGFDSITGKKVRHRLVVAIDVFSRCILSARFFENDPKGIDVTFMLYDIIAPKVAPSDWPEQAMLPYIGIPESLSLELHGLKPGTRLKGIPFARPDNLTIDNGKIFVSKVFESACERLGISLIIARPYTGNDKAHVERFFETARDGFCIHLPGYTGNNPMNRGANPEADAYYFRHELEAEFHLWLSRVYHVRQHAGLREHEVPAVEHTPIEKFRAGINASGYLHVPNDQNLYQQLLETEWRKIHAYGVECYGIYYDAPELTPYRNTSCTYSIGKGGRWPFKVDPRDLRYIHFQLPDTGAWIRLTRRDAKFADIPFTAFNLQLAREKVIAEGGKVRSHNDVSDALEELLSNQRTQVAQNRAQRRREVKALHQFERALADQGQLSQQEAASRAMDVAERLQNPETPEVMLRPGKGFGNVDELERNVANVFARGATSFWNSDEEEE